MRIGLHTNDADLSEAFRSYLERRLRFALGRFGDRVGEVTVRLARDGRTVHHCRIAAEIVPFGRVAVEERDPDLFAAMDRATGRIGRLFGRELQRTHDFRPRRESIRTAA